MKLLPPLVLLITLGHAADDTDAIRHVLASFSDARQRPSVLTGDADLAPLTRLPGWEASQVYFEARSIKFLTPDIAFIDAAASQYGTLILKHSVPAYFVLRRVAGEWRVAVFRVDTPWPAGMSVPAANPH
jgi:hypothetical protein